MKLYEFTASLISITVLTTLSMQWVVEVREVLDWFVLVPFAPALWLVFDLTKRLTDRKCNDSAG